MTEEMDNIFLTLPYRNVALCTNAVLNVMMADRVHLSNRYYVC